MAEHPLIKTPRAYVAAIAACAILALISLYLFLTSRDLWGLWVILFSGLAGTYVFRFRRFLSRHRRQ